MKDKLLQIINHYGIMHQLKYFQSEVFELNEAIINHQNKNSITIATENLNKSTYRLIGKEYKISSIEHIAEEIADVMVMLEQFRLYYGISDMKIKDIMINKIDRQLERIKNENN